MKTTSRKTAIAFYCLLLLLVAPPAWWLWESARDRWRGVVRGVPPQTRQTDAAPWGTTVALTQYTDAELERALSRLADMGVVWLRQEVPWAEVEPGRGTFAWQRWDRVLTAAHKRGFRLILVLNTSPAWARPAWPATRVAPPARVEDFARFAERVAERYGDIADVYQVWDQPNVRPHWGLQPIDPAGYAHLLHAAAPRIRAADTGALILAAGLAPTTEPGGRNMSEIRFLEALYQAGAADDFDVVAYKAFGFWSGPDDRRYSEAILNWSRAALLREVMVRAGDSETPIWFTEGGWATLPADWQGAPAPWGSDRPTVQRQRLRQAVARTRLEWPWVEVLALQRYQPQAPAGDPVWGLALAEPDGTLTPLGETWQQLVAESDVLTPGWWSADGWPRNRFTGNRIRVRGSDVLGRTDGRSPLRPIATDLDPDVVTEIALPETVPNVLVVAYDPPTWWRWWTAVALAATLTVGLTARLAWLVWHLPWASWRSRYRALPESFQVGGVAVAITLFLLAPQNPVLNLLLFLGIGVLVWTRLDLGLAAILATLPFFLWGRSFGPKTFSLPELLLVLCALRWAAVSTEDVRRETSGIAAWVSRHVSYLFEKLRPYDFLDWSVAALVALAAVSVFWAQLFGVAAREFRVVVLEPAAFYWLIRRAGLTRRQIRRLIDALLLGGVLVSGHALWQLVDGSAVAAEGVLRVKGPYGSPNNLSLYLGRLIPLALTLGIWNIDHHETNDQGSKTKDILRITHYVLRITSHPTIYLGTLLPIGLALLFTFSRGALLLGLPAALLYLAVISGSRRGRLVAVGATVLAVVALVPFARTERLQSLFDPTTGTWHLRLLLWRASVDMLRDFPLLGVGLDNFLYVYPDYRYEAAWREPNLNHPHNVVLHFWLALGLAGLVILLWQQFAFWRTARRLQRRLTLPFDRALLAGATAVMVYTLAHGLIDNSFFLVDLAFVWMLVLGVIGWLKTNASAVL